ncbi:MULTISPECIES: TadE/TadG family type IV pilus assembly protein [Neobacillus]|uniref:Pilus assembly protein n=1 Tax=Neobacillus rhizophilus TaxID=2833579 RepID=A0A942U9G6_9BACI|nr:MULTISPECIES: TadE/TadG family type IV pilus assembly protein [Neobacillus]MBS4213279.1 pilus assembly protein [Neobacillus rhizophilus]
MKSEKGQSLVEFALVLPVLLLLLFGIVDFGRILHAYLTIDHAGREAARAASIGSANIEQVAVENAVGISLTTGNVKVTKGSPTSNDVTIAITYPITFLTPIISSVIGEVELKDKTVMRVE